MSNNSLEDLILGGMVEVAGIDSDTGEFLYNFTNKFYEYMPELFAEKINLIKTEMKFFLENGFVEIDDIESENPLISLTDKAFNEYEIEKLSKEKQHILREIKRFFEER